MVILINKIKNYCLFKDNYIQNLNIIEESNTLNLIIVTKIIDLFTKSGQI